MKRKIAEETRSVESKAAPKNLFELQVDDFLDDLVLSYDRRLATEAFAEKIQSWISSSGGLPSVELSNTKWMNIHRVSFPITLPFEIAISNIKIPQHCMWSQPASIKILESWHIGLATKHKPYLEMAVTMPKEFFGPRDFINFGYHVKRAQYACMIACVLVDYCKKMTWYVTDNRDLQPDLLVYESDHEDSPAVLLCFVPPAEFAPLSRFAPLTNNIRPSFLPEYKQTMVEDNVPSPYYNSSILCDLTRCDFEQYIGEMLSDKPNCIKAIMLLEVWKCRRLFLGMNGVTDRLLSAWVVFLLLSGTIGEGTSPVGIVAAVFNSFASSDWRKSRFSLRKDIDESLWSQFESEYSYVFLDNSGYFNIAGALEVQTIEDLRCLASDSLKKLNYFNEFDELFVQEHPFSLSFDYYLKFYVKLSELRKMVRVLSVKEYTDSCGHYFAAFLKQSSKLLDKAWSGRVSSFEFWSGSVTPKNEWPINEEPSSLQEELVFTIGTRVFTTWDNVLSRGPPAKSEGAVQFRKFWGETCELRKFADNAICESIIWRSEGSSETVLSMIARHILKRHLKLDMDSLFDCMNPSGFDLPGTISRYEHISQTFQKLSKELRLVKDLPLMITGVQPYSSFLRKTSPFAPPATDDVMKPQDCSVDGVIAFPRLRWSPSYLPSVDVLLTMEQSGKWGEDLPTICRLKAAFYIALAKLLSKKSNARFIPFIDALLVNMDSVLFRIIISYPKEVHIIKKIAGGHSGVLKETAESRRKERELIMRPQLASHLFSVSQQHPAFSMAVRIVKRWLSVHMLSGFIDDTIVETIVASVFIRPLMPATPRNPLIAFLHFLILISTHNWLVKPLCVDFNNDWKDSDLNVLEEEFLKMRPVLPAMVVCTAVDRSGARFTREEPQPVILKRLIAVASMTAEFFNRHLTSEESYNINDALSVEPMKFDAVIQLHGRHLVYRNQTRSGKEADALPVFDYDPILFFVERLRDDYGNVALFFYDKYGGDTIGVVWRPSAKENRPLNVSSCLNRMKTAEGDLTLNIPAIFEDFHIIGHGLVRSVKQCVLSE